MNRTVKFVNILGAGQLGVVCNAARARSARRSTVICQQQHQGCTGVQLGFLWYATLSARGHVFRPKRKGSGYTTRAITHCCTGSRQYGQIFMLAAQRSHAS